MTIKILQSIGVEVYQKKDKIVVLPLSKTADKEFYIESDWSSASYFYSAVAVLKISELQLESFFSGSLQGDSQLVDLYEKFGVETVFNNNLISLKYRQNFTLPQYLEFNLIRQPDLAQTIAVTCLALGIKCKITGLQTLRIKETDRLFALQQEMQKLGAGVRITDTSFELLHPVITNPNVSIATYNDHRMAMSFAVLQKIYSEIRIENKDVVVKSFPGFWNKFQFV
jgi:3-phosphoshikimate 1-carboxyvinyltransferase